MEEGQIKEEFGLKNKTEIWKTEAKVKEMRERAKNLISAPKEEQQKFFDRLNSIGLNVKSIGDVLALDKKDYLQRRLQTVLVRKTLARTIRESRQLIVHKKVSVDGKVVNIPSYIVSTELEDKITVKAKKPAVKKEAEEVTQ